MESQNMIDIYRRLNILRREYTYNYTGNRGSRIDTFLEHFQGQIYTKAGILEFKISDHKLIYLELKQNKRIKWGRVYGS